MPTSKLKIPDSQLHGLIALLHLSSQDRKVLLQGIAAAAPLSDYRAYVNPLAQRTSIDAGTVRAILDILVGLHVAMDDLGLDTPQLARELKIALEQLPPEDLELVGKTPTTKDWQALERFMASLFSSDAGLTLTSKAYSVLWEYPDRYCTARVLTDLRPVFGSNVDEQPLAVIPVHTLKLTYHQGTATKEIFITMDRDDVDQLCILLERAKKKEDSLKRVAREKSLALLEARP